MKTEAHLVVVVETTASKFLSLNQEINAFRNQVDEFYITCLEAFYRTYEQ